MADQMELMHEILKDIQRTLSDHTSAHRDTKENLIALREDVHGIRGDLLRHEKAFASLESDVDRIKQRLDLTD